MSAMSAEKRPKTAIYIRLDLDGKVLKKLDAVRGALSRTDYVRLVVYRQLGFPPPLPSQRRVFNQSPMLLQAAIRSGRLNPAEKKIAELRLAGYSYGKILKHLEQADIPTRHGKHWHRQTIAVILDRIARIGVAECGILDQPFSESDLPVQDDQPALAS
jgi:hypothetical protein